MLICITGIDGCGKSIQIKFLKDYLEKKGYNVAISKAYGEAEKELFSLYIENLHQTAILFLFEAMHAQQCILAKQELARGKIVIADRWDESYLVYHSHYGVLKDKPKLRAAITKLSFQGIVPDITFLLKVSYEAAQKRCEARGLDYFDKKPKEYHETMQKGYINLIKKRGGIIINGEQSIKLIHQEIISHLPL